MNTGEKQPGRNWSFRSTAEEFAWMDERRRSLSAPTVAAYIRFLLAVDRQLVSAAARRGVTVAELLDKMTAECGAE